MPNIVICSSALFYRQAIEIQAQLIERGYQVTIPHNAQVMKDTGDYEVSHYKTWYGSDEDYPKKAEYMRRHFDEIAGGDAVLVLNYEKNGQDNYIGGNVLMEMSLAFYLRKPVYILNDIPEYSPYVEEIKGFLPIVLHGNLSNLLSTQAN